MINLAQLERNFLTFLDFCPILSEMSEFRSVFFNFYTIFGPKLQLFKIALELRKIVLELRKIALELHSVFPHFASEIRTNSKK